MNNHELDQAAKLLEDSVSPYQLARRLVEAEEREQALAAKAEHKHPDDLAVDKFSEAMKGKLSAARGKGRGGWDDPERCSIDFLAKLLFGHLEKSNDMNYVDIANFCMMLHLRNAPPQLLSSLLAKRDLIKQAEGADMVAESAISRKHLDAFGSTSQECASNLATLIAKDLRYLSETINDQP